MLPSPVRTSTASWCRRTIVPGSPDAGGPGSASNTDTSRPQSVVRTPGDPSAARMRRRIVSVLSDQANRRSSWRIAGRRRPITSACCSSNGSRFERRVGRLVDDLDDQLDRRVGDRPVVDGALGRRIDRHRERPRAPDRTGIHLLDGLQRGDSPHRLAVGDRPVQRRRPTVALRAGMDDDRAVAAPDVRRDPLAEERADDQVGRASPDGGGDRRLADGELDGHVVTATAQLEPCSLAQAVEGRAQQQDPHRRTAPRAVVSSASTSTRLNVTDSQSSPARSTVIV